MVMGILSTPANLLSTASDLTPPHFGFNILGLLFPEAKGTTKIPARQRVAIKGQSLLKGHGNQARQAHRLVKCPGYFAVIQFFSWQYFIMLALFLKMTEHHVSMHRGHSLCRHSKESSLLTRQVKKFHRFILAACWMGWNGVILPQKDRR